MGSENSLSPDVGGHVLDTVTRNAHADGQFVGMTGRPPGKARSGQPGLFRVRSLALPAGRPRTTSSGFGRGDSERLPRFVRSSRRLLPRIQRVPRQLTACPPRSSRAHRLNLPSPGGLRWRMGRSVAQFVGTLASDSAPVTKPCQQNLGRRPPAGICRPAPDPRPRAQGRPHLSPSAEGLCVLTDGQVCAPNGP